LNVTTDLAGFGLIVPCGIAGKGVTSLQRLLGRDVAMAEVESACLTAFGDVFDRLVVENPTKSVPDLLPETGISS
jgi:lipoate-protein ligase B